MGAADNLGEGREGGDEAEGIPLQALPVDLHLSCRMQLGNWGFAIQIT